jgi:hypothetical protein
MARRNPRISVYQGAPLPRFCCLGHRQRSHEVAEVVGQRMARPSPQPGQTNRSGQRRSNGTPRTRFQSHSSLGTWNSINDLTTPETRPQILRSRHDPHPAHPIRMIILSRRSCLYAKSKRIGGSCICPYGHFP